MVSVGKIFIRYEYFTKKNVHFVILKIECGNKGKSTKFQLYINM